MDEMDNSFTIQKIYMYKSTLTQKIHCKLIATIRKLCDAIKYSYYINLRYLQITKNTNERLQNIAIVKLHLLGSTFHSPKIFMYTSELFYRMTNFVIYIQQLIKQFTLFPFVLLNPRKTMTKS